MVANYEVYGFEVTAKIIPETCTVCPFWLADTETVETGMCFITGHETVLDGEKDTKRMDDCPITERRATT